VAVDAVNPAGPLQEYDVAPVALALKFTVPPIHTALVFVGAADGKAFTATVVW